MLTEPLIQQLQELRLRGMAAALEQQLSMPNPASRSFEERLGSMIQHERADRSSLRLAQRLRWARLPQPACLEDLDTRTPRGVDAGQLGTLTDLGWIREHLNLLVTGPCGVGKSYIASALAHAACRADFSVRCFRLPRLVEELARRMVKKTAALAGVDAARAGARLTIDRGWLGRGYGYSTREGDRAMAEASRLGLALDGTYTAKAFAAAVSLAQARTGEVVLYWHTLSSAPLPDAPPLSDELERLFR